MCVCMSTSPTALLLILAVVAVENQHILQQQPLSCITHSNIATFCHSRNFRLCSSLLSIISLLRFCMTLFHFPQGHAGNDVHPITAHA